MRVGEKDEGLLVPRLPLVDNSPSYALRAFRRDAEFLFGLDHVLRLPVLLGREPTIFVTRNDSHLPPSRAASSRHDVR
jgi:hypothetical protein